MRARIHRPFAVIFNLSTPENHLSFVIDRLKFEPDVEGIHRSAGEEVADFARPNHDFHSQRIAATHGRL